MHLRAALLCSAALLISTLVISFVHDSYMDMDVSKSVATVRTSQDVDNFDNFSLDAHYVIPNTVFYAWCAKSTHFRFRNYLSVKSVLKYVKPDKVVLFYEEEPSSSIYDTWLSELIDTFAVFSIEKLPTNWCKNMTANIEMKLFETGGIYIREDVILTSFSHRYRSNFNSITVNDVDGNPLVHIRRSHLSASDLSNYSLHSTRFLVGRKQLPLKMCKLEKGSMQVTSLFNTPTIEEWINRTSAKILLFLAQCDFIPEDIWKLDSDAGRILRLVMYNTPHFVGAVNNYDQLAPNIAHIVWSNNDTMSFHFYLCVLSLVDVAKVDSLYIHGASSPSGFYWNLIRDHPKIRLVYRTLLGLPYESAYGNKIEGVVHMSDIWRSDILRRFGGLYVDNDVLFFRPLDREIRSYDAVISKDVKRQPPFPEYYENAVMLGKPNAQFWTLHVEEYKHFVAHDYFLTCCKQLYKIKERHPEVVHEEPRLNVICFESHCFPSWMPHLRRNVDHHLVTGSMKNWKTDCYSIHHTYPILPELSDHIGLLANNGTTLFGEIALYILEQAGKKDFFVKLAASYT